MPSYRTIRVSEYVTETNGVAPITAATKAINEWVAAGWELFDITPISFGQVELEPGMVNSMLNSTPVTIPRAESHVYLTFRSVN